MIKKYVGRLGRWLSPRKDTSYDLGELLTKKVERGAAFFVFTSLGSILLWRCGLEDTLEALKKGSRQPSEFGWPQLASAAFWDELGTKLSHNISVGILSIAVFLWFRTYKSAALNEIRLIRSLFSESRRPTEWRELSNPWIVAIIAYFFYAVFFVMAYFVNTLPIVGGMIAALYILDLFGNRLTQLNLKKFLHNEHFHPKGPLAAVIRQKREAAERYWLDLPHYERIIFCLLITMVGWAVLPTALAAVDYKAVGVDWSKQIGAASLAQHVSFGLLAVVILGNEVTMYVWRRRRDMSWPKSIAPRPSPGRRAGRPKSRA